MEKYGVLFETIFKRNLTDQDVIGHLETITAEHPYFSAAQFYLLQLLPKDTAEYKIQAKKTAALFNNNHWLNFQLLEAGRQITFSPKQPAAPLNVAEPVIVEQTEEIVIGNEEDADASYVPSTMENMVMDENETKPVILEQVEEIVIGDKEEADTPPTYAPSTMENIVTDQTETGPLIEEQAEIYTQAEKENNAVIDPVQDHTLSLETEIAGQTAIVENNDADEATTQPEPLADEITSSVQPVEEITLVEEEKQVNNELAASIVPETETTSVIITGEQLEEAAITEADNTNAAETVAVSEPLPTGTNLAPGMPEAAVQEPVQDILFEPLHTSDYFASVGIKLSEEEKTADKLGKQLKSFTDWLKTMKKTHAGQLTQVTKPAAVETSATDSNIQKLAEKSNQENDVITEAMAEVLVQQGREDKALEILEKLSLLNPTKSAYFAAKINQIKEK